MVDYLDLRHVIAMHEVLIEKYGGLHGIRDKGLLESAGNDLFPDVSSKAAAYAYYLSENQPFLDGNKRIATAAAATFLRLNGYDLKASDRELYETIMQLANKAISRDDLAAWFSRNSVRKKGKR